MKYRVFTNDVGPNGFSCYNVIKAASDESAILKAVKAVRRFAPVKVLAIPDDLVSKLGTGGTDPGGIRFSPDTFRRYGAEVRASS